MQRGKKMAARNLAQTRNRRDAPARNRVLQLMKFRALIQNLQQNVQSNRLL